MVFRDLSKTICYNPRLPFGFKEWMIYFFFFVKRTVKLANKERFDKEPICHLLHKDKELLALRSNFRATKKFLISKFDCNSLFSCQKSKHLFDILKFLDL